MVAEFWWIIPLGMMIFCFLMMRGSRGRHMCGSGSHDHEPDNTCSDTALEIVKKRYAGRAIDKEEFFNSKRRRQ